MAIVKCVKGGGRSVGRAINYVANPEKTNDSLMFGIGCSREAEQAIFDFSETKELWGKSNGAQYYHYVLAFDPNDDLKPSKAFRIGLEWARKEFAGFETFGAVHTDKDHLHVHFIVNSVSNVNGSKLQKNKFWLKEAKLHSDQICEREGLSVCKKGTAQDTTAYDTKTYAILKKAEIGQAKSYVWDIALVVTECRTQATSREDFISRLKEKGINVEWLDNHKYITFTASDGGKVRNNKLEKYFNIDFTKQGLENEFETNLRGKEERERSRKHLDNGSTEGDDRGSDTNGGGAFIGKLNASERVAKEERQARDEEQRRLDSERQRRIEEAQRKADERKRRSNQNQNSM